MQSSFFSIFCFTSFWLHLNWTASLTESEFRLDWILLQRTIGHHIPRIQRIFVFRFHFDHTHTRGLHGFCHFSFSIVHWFIRKLVSASSKTKSHWNYGFSSGRVAPTVATNKNIGCGTEWHLKWSVRQSHTYHFNYVSHGICVERPYVLITKKNNDRQKKTQENVKYCDCDSKLEYWIWPKRTNRIIEMLQLIQSFLLLPLCPRSTV